jgi:hypothetical protein
MGSQPTSTSAGVRPGYAASLAARDWSLLVRLPSRVLAAVLAARTEPPTMGAALAGLAEIAAARSPSRAGAALTREVATTIFASDDPPDGPEPPRPDAVRVECAVAGYVLAHRVPSGDAEEYRRWVRRIGVAALASAEPVDPIGAAPVRLLDEYGRALAG